MLARTGTVPARVDLSPSFHGIRAAGWFSRLKVNLGPGLLKIEPLSTDTSTVRVLRLPAHWARCGVALLCVTALGSWAALAAAGQQSPAAAASAPGLQWVGVSDQLAVAGSVPSGVAAAPWAGLVADGVTGQVRSRLAVVGQKAGGHGLRSTMFTPAPLHSAANAQRSDLSTRLQGLTRATGLRVEGLATPLGQDAPSSAPGGHELPTGISATAVPTVRVWTPPVDYLVRYQSAAAQFCPSAGWAVLAAVGQVETGHGATMGPSSAGALGPMQFMPATWAGMLASGQAIDADRNGSYDIGDPDDAIATAAVKLCSDGATSPVGTLKALWHYNHSWSYVALVAQLAHAYNAAYPSLPAAPLPATKNSPGRTVEQAAAHAGVSYTLSSISVNAVRSAVVQTAYSYLGVPYLWGGTDPSVGLDCSGLTQLVYAQHGVMLARVSTDQARMGQPVESLDQALPGDLLAFGSPVDHIGIYLGNGMILHAPRTGKMVEIAPVRGVPTAIRRVLNAQAAAALTVPTVNGLAGSAAAAQTQTVSIFPVSGVSGLAAAQAASPASRSADQGPDPFAASR